MYGGQFVWVLGHIGEREHGRGFRRRWVADAARAISIEFNAGFGRMLPAWSGSRRL